MDVTAYYFPLMFVQPAPGWDVIEAPPFRIARRLWETSTFDLATLATRHKLHLPYQLMDVMLSRCHTEVRIEAGTHDHAVDLLHTLLLGLYVEGLSPTFAPFSTTFSINEYSGINSRDSDSLRSKLPEELRVGLTSDTGVLEAWPVHLSFTCHVLPDGLTLATEQFKRAAEAAWQWEFLESRSSTLRVVRDAAQAAPLISSRDQSLLHIWCALEALFPRVSTEVSFRVAIYLAQLMRKQRSEQFTRVRKAYNLRSSVAHGSKRNITEESWRQSWGILMDAARSVIERGVLPNEDDLLSELFAGEAAVAQQSVAADGASRRS